MDSEGIDNQHDITYGLDGGESAISWADTENTEDASQDEPDLVQLFLRDAEEEEEEDPPRTLLDIFNSDTQSEKQDSEGDGDQSGKRQQQCSETSGSDSAVVEEEGDGDGEKCSSAEVVEGESSQVQRLVSSPGSKSHGVHYHNRSKQWEAYIWIPEVALPGRVKNGIQIFGGYHKTEDEAKHAHDRLAIKLNIRQTLALQGNSYRLNFPESAQADFLADHQDWSERDFVWLIRRLSSKFSRGKSGMKGVTVRPTTRKRLRPGEEESGPAERYVAKISRGRASTKESANIGTFGSQEEAGKAYDRALLFINKDKEGMELWTVITNFRPSSYTTAEVLEAGSQLVFRLQGQRNA